MGSFSWVLILSVVFLVKGRSTAGVHGLLICLIAVLLAFLISPWRYPDTLYWKLLLPLYLLFTAAVIWAVKGFGEGVVSALNWWNVLPMLPLLLPILLLGNRKWGDD